MLKLERVTTTSDIREINEILARDGCIVIENLMDHSKLASLRSELSLQFQSTPVCQGDFYGYQTKRLSGLMAKSAIAQEMAIHPTVLGVMDNFLLQGCGEYQINLTQAIAIGPGEPEQIIHTDDAMFPFSHPAAEAMINCMWAVDDFRADNGGTQVVPGSHKWEHGRRPTPEEIVKAEMPAGSLLIYLGSLLHGGGANTSTSSRTGMVISYNLGWLKQAENQFLAVPKAIASDLPERLQRLLGYFVHKPNLGCVNGQDPILLLQQDGTPDGFFQEFLPDSVKPILADYQKQVRRSA